LTESPTTELLTFLLTDIEGSTARWERDRDAMAAAVRRHDQLTLETVTGAGGRVVKSTGDGAHAVFSEPESAAAAALKLSERLLHEDWPPLSTRSASAWGSILVRPKPVEVTTSDRP
jgi:class 3 adenylate cyclase